MIDIKTDDTLSRSYHDPDSSAAISKTWCIAKSELLRHHAETLDSAFYGVGLEFSKLLHYFYKPFVEKAPWTFQIPGVSLQLPTVNRINKFISILFFAVLITSMAYLATPLVYCAAAMIVYRCSLEIIYSACQGALLILKLYNSVYHSDKLSSLSMLSDQSTLNALEAKLNLHISTKVPQTQYPLEQVKILNKRCELLLKQIDSLIQEQISHAFPRHDRKFKEHLLSIFKAQRSHALQVAQSQIQDIYTEAHLNREFDCWHQFFLHYPVYAKYQESRNLSIACMTALSMLSTPTPSSFSALPLFKEVFIKKHNLWPVDKKKSTKLHELTRLERATHHTKFFIDFFSKECEALRSAEDNDLLSAWQDYIMDRFNAACSLEQDMAEDLPQYTDYWSKTLKEIICTINPPDISIRNHLIFPEDLSPDIARGQELGTISHAGSALKPPVFS